MNRKKVIPFLFLGLLLFPSFGQGEDLGLKIFSWGLTLPELNRLYQEKSDPGMVLREESTVYEYEITIAPNKTRKIPRGGLTAIEEITRGAKDSTVGRLFGYLWEGKFFGRVILFTNRPGQNRTQFLRYLKTQFPEGRLFHKYSEGLMTGDFELDSGGMLIFTDSRGIYLYDPLTLKRVLREAERDRQEQLEREEKRIFEEEGKKPM